MHIRAQFPILSSCTYLNTASTGLLSSSLSQWRIAHEQAFYLHGDVFRENQVAFFQGVKKELAAFFNADWQNTYLLPNFSFGFNTILKGIPKEKRFLLLEEDYPSINYAVKNHGFANHVVAMNGHLEENITRAIERYKPDVLALSLVQYRSGIKLDFRLFNDLKERYPELLIIADGTQFCGTEQFDFERSGIDILVASGYKWMLAGFGNGFLFLGHRAQDTLFTHLGNFTKPSEDFLQHKSRLSFYFEPGHLDTLAQGSLQHSIRFFRKSDFKAMVDALRVLAQQAKEAFAERGLLAPSVAIRPVHSTIFNLHLQRKSYHGLRDKNIACSFRGEGVRVAFGFYNNKEDLDYLLTALDD